MTAKIGELDAEDSAIDWRAMTEEERKRAEKAILDNFEEDMTNKGIDNYKPKECNEKRD